MFWQIFFGSSLLVICALVHVAVVASGIPLLVHLSERLNRWSEGRRVPVILSAGILLLLFAHTIEIWAWAICFWVLGAFEQFTASFYFAIVTYTTLGYGDLVLDEGLRIFASFASITGLLTFGISTAFLIALISRTMPSMFDADRP